MSRQYDVTPDGGATGSASEPADECGFFIGKIEAVVGSCTLTRACNGPVQIKSGDPVCQGDVIETAAGGKVCIRFVDGTEFNLSDRARMVLTEFAGDAASPSALFDITNGTFAFIAGEMVKAGRLGIDTPFASIRGRSRAGGIGMLSLASLFFSAIDEVQATPDELFRLDPGIIDFRESQEFLEGKFSHYELSVKGDNPRTLICCDADEAIILRPVGGSMVESRVSISLADYLNASRDQQTTQALSTHAGPAGVGNGGSGGVLPEFHDFIPPSNGAQPISFTTPPPLTLPGGNSRRERHSSA